MELRGSDTEKSLLEAFARELQNNARYTYFASAARDGFEEIADVFLATAKNEAEHARHEFDFLGGAGDIVANLEMAISREHEEATQLYPGAAEVADREGFTEITDFFRRMSQVEEKHEKNFRGLLETLNKGGTFQSHTVGHSAVEMAQVMLPDQANPAGFVHGGELMKLMDNAAGVVAARHSRTNIVTGRIEDIVFHKPVRVGSLVIIRGKIIFTSRSSMAIRVEVEAEDLRNGEKNRALTANVIMVALDAQGQPAEVPPLMISTEEEARLFSQAQARYESRKATP